MTRPAVETESISPLAAYVTETGYRVARYGVSLEAVPADFFADPDGSWTFEELAAAAGFGDERGVAVGALREPFGVHPDGAAVVTLDSVARPYVAIIECPIGYALISDADRTETSAA